MRADELVALATAHGIDLSHVGGSASDTQGIARQRTLTREERKARQEQHLGLDVLPTARGSGSRTYRRPTWSVAELGQAAQGVHQIPWLAARYSFAGDETGYWRLWYALTFEAHRAARREGWAPRVMGRTPRDKNGKPVPGKRGEPRFYLQDLAQLVLDEEAHRAYFLATPALFALYVNVEDDVWAKLLSPRYECVKARYQSWLETARSMIQRKLLFDTDVPATETGRPRAALMRDDWDKPR